MPARDSRPSGSVGDATVVEATTAEVQSLQRRLERERRARAESEAIAERATRDLYDALTDVGRRVEERTAELSRALSNLEDVNAELARFAYVAAHDLQTPLRSIAGFLQLLDRRYGEALDDRARDWIHRSVESAEHLKVLIEDLLSYARVEADAHVDTPVPLNDVFECVGREMSGMLEEEGARLTRDDLPVVTGDRAQIRSLVQNLIENALRFRSAAPPEVHVGAELAEVEWIVSVRDNGIGIEPIHHERIFELFRRLHTRRECPGTGIGLSVCRRVVERHGGRIWVDSTLGKGSIFRFSLPVRGPSDEPGVHERSDDAVTGG